MEEAIKEISIIAKEAKLLNEKSAELSGKINDFAVSCQNNLLSSGDSGSNFILLLSIFVLACFVGYYVVWKVTPSLHTPLMSLTNAISSIIILGAIITVGAKGFGSSHFLGFISITIAAINIFGGFVVTQRMLAMFKKKQ